MTVHVLVIDTALNACSVGLAPAERTDCPTIRFEPMTKGHGEVLMPMIEGLAADAGVALGTLSRIVVTTGPGHFTGARVGLAAARGLALALDCPCIGVSTLEALLAGLPDGDGPGVAAIDARREEVYLLMDHPDAVPGLLSIEDAVGRVRAAAGSGCVRLTGSGAPLLAGPLRAAGVETVDAGQTLIDPAVLFRFAGADPDTRPPRPLYLRAPDATPPAPPAWMARP